MTVELTGLCRDHSFETSENVCRRCGLEYCELCLVYPFGAKKPLCKECAMVAGGVRSHGARPEMTKRELKQRVKAWGQRAAKVRKGAPADDTDAISDPLLNDPLAAPGQDLERVPATVPVDNGAHLAATFAESVSEPPPPPPPPAPAPAPAEEPADGVAPPIDWSQPFG